MRKHIHAFAAGHTVRLTDTRGRVEIISLVTGNSVRRRRPDHSDSESIGRRAEAPPARPLTQSVLPASFRL